MEYRFTKEELLSAIQYLDEHPEDFKGRFSSTYDLVYENKKYPPILVLSKANELKGGKELLLSDFKNSTDIAFKNLVEFNFDIVKKKTLDSNFSIYLKEFIRQSNTTDLSYKKYSILYQDTKVKASFGQGGVANVPWISFTLDPNTTSTGFYPVYLYFKSEQLLLLAFGISETNRSLYDWKNEVKLQTINELYSEKDLGKPFRYGDSFVFKSYDVNHLPSNENLDQDLTEIIQIYKETMEGISTEVPVEKLSNMDFSIQPLISSLKQANLQFNENLLRRFVSSLITKPFAILTGLSGSGKTKLAQSFIQWICENEEQYVIVPVGSDWINREPLLGYPNGLKEDEYVMPDNGVLKLIIDATKDENQNKPFFLVLDEMNLSHVERYFADFLSIMESNDSIKLYTSIERKSTDGILVPKSISWPKNLFIIGTVNIDETTYMFSPKVLDRANVIEFRLNDSDLEKFLSKPLKADLLQLIGHGSTMASSFLNLSNETETEANKELNETLLEFFKELKAIGSEFGYRSAFEIHLLFAQFSKLDTTLTTDEKIDFAVMQKLLPKLHGSRSKIVKSLEALMRLCLNDAKLFNLAKLDDVESPNIKYKVSFDKLKRMYNNAVNNGFTSYAEA
ncbi:McrB family protein [Sphingobacterium cellulitidis]|uniref:McrB family protein n=1 Tax=Sphingobacterium cellulitidis TaxID=1768011 RepID=UPI003C798ACC